MLRITISLVLFLFAFSPSFVVAQLKVKAKQLRDPAKEDAVAQMFEKSRQEQGAKKLGRIQWREEVQADVCNAVVKDQGPVSGVNVPWLLYKTRSPLETNAQLLRLAAYDKEGKQGYRRYAVAVWRSASTTSEYWVGIKLFWSAGFEFFDNHFTDDIYSHNDWKKTVVPECLERYSPKRTATTVPSSTVRLCLRGIAGAPKQNSVANALVTLPPNETVREKVRFDLQAESQAQQTCDYVIELGNPHFQNSCAVAPGSTTACLEEQSRAAGDGRSSSVTTQLSVELSLSRPGNSRPLLSTTITNVLQANSIHSGEDSQSSFLAKDVLDAVAKAIAP